MLHRTDLDRKRQVWEGLNRASPWSGPHLILFSKHEEVHVQHTLLSLETGKVTIGCEEYLPTWEENCGIHKVWSRIV